MRRSMTLWLSFSLIAVVPALNGCTTAAKSGKAYKLWQERNEGMKQEYLAWLESPSLPTHEEAKAAGVPWSFNRPLADVWQSCVDVAAQLPAVLASHCQADGPRQIIVLAHGASSPVIGSQLFLVVSAMPLSPQRTEVVVAPLAGCGTLMELSSEQLATGGAEATDRQVYEGIAVQLAGLGVPTTAISIAREESFAHATVNRFFNDLAVQMLGPSRWEALYTTGPRLGGKSLQDFKPATMYCRKEIENKAGNFISASLRRSHVIVTDPEMSRILGGIIRDLLNGAGATDCTVNTYVIVSPDVNAFALPNGDVFVCSALLDSLDDRNELAFVLAHELVHLVEHDSLDRLKRADLVKRTQYAAMGVGMIAVPIAGPLLGLSSGAATATAATAGTMMARQVATSVIMSTVSTVAKMLGDAASAAIVEGYSERCELRADTNAAQYAFAAGYDPSAVLGVFAKLHAIEATAADARTTISSSLINAKPGLEKRVDRMRTTLAELGVVQTDKH